MKDLYKGCYNCATFDRGECDARTAEGEDLYYVDGWGEECARYVSDVQNAPTN